MGNLKWAPTAPSGKPLCIGEIAIEGVNAVVAGVLARSPFIVGTQVAEQLVQATASKDVLETVAALGEDPDYVYCTDPAVESGTACRVPFKLFPARRA